MTEQMSLVAETLNVINDIDEETVFDKDWSRQ